ARAAPSSNVTLAGVTRDARVVRATLDARLDVLRVDELAPRFEATESTALTPIDDGAVVVRGRVAGASGTWLLRAGAPPAPIDAGACAVAGGVAWIFRSPEEGDRVRFVRGGEKSLETTSGPIARGVDAE